MFTLDFDTDRVLFKATSPRWRRAALVAAIAALSAGPAHANSPFRFDDDVSAYSDQAHSIYARMKFVPLGPDAADFISFGADFRERIESSNVAALGLRYARANTYVLQRALAHVDLHYGALRTFIQLGSETEHGRMPGALATDVDHLDVAQAFLDYRFDDSLASLLRIGRFEMSFDEGAMVGLRDGPNVRLSWDGVHYEAAIAATRVDVFAAKPVGVGSGVFDDQPLSGQRLWGVHAEWLPDGVSGSTRVNGFYFGNEMPHVAVGSAPAEERTQTVGIRIRKEVYDADGSLGLIGQTGEFGAKPVRAWSTHLDAGWTARRVAWAPRLGIRLDVLSGGDDSRVVRTFNALYPNYAFSTEATLEAPANLVQPAITVDIHPSGALLVEYKAEGLWRYSTRDAFYAAPLFPLVRPGIDAGRFSGTEQQLYTSFLCSRVVSVSAALVHFNPSTFLRDSHATSENFGMAQVSIRL